MRTVIDFAEYNELRADWAAKNESVAFVPTMGALHDGHLTLALNAKSLADRVVVSIFVNPAQFGPNEDFSRYPRTLREDLALLDPIGVDAVFLPNTKEIYPEGFQTWVQNRQLSHELCGAQRPGHFDGVCTVVLKLFNIVRPHMALFGKKDYQQWRIIERMVKDLNLNLQVIGCETVREEDGLAKSSRNRYLSPSERQTATMISKALKATKEKFMQGNKKTKPLMETFQSIIEKAPEIQVQYAEIRSQIDLLPFGDVIDKPAVMLVAAMLGQTRLIDNLEF